MESTGPLRAVRTWEEALPDHGAEQRAVHEAMLLTVGERGYDRASVREVAERAGITQDRFHRRFGGKAACFAAAYGEAAEQLGGVLLGACRGASGWREGFSTALAELLRSVAEQPLLSRALLLEVRAARGEAWVEHQRLSERLIEVLEGAREQPGARPSSSPVTAGFVLGAIEETICVELAAGRAAEIERLHPDLTRLAFLQLFGEDE